MKLKDNPFLYNEKLIGFPDLHKLSVVHYSFNLEHYHRVFFEHFAIVCPASISGSVIKRQAEFLAGRFCAAQALLIKSATNTHISIGKNRAPVWPIGFIGSITHSRNIAMAAVARVDEYQYVGLDVEDMMSAELALSISASIIQDKEFDLLHNSGLDFSLGLTIAFSMKEALFKALYPSVGEYFDFHAAELIDINLANNHVSMRLLENLSTRFSKGKVFNGYIDHNEDCVTSLICG
ncbi:4'-phosphopantetheinyl transferase superfamily protein [Shewanella sp. VB17]|uniref:4'-phosphopantetheinyl transferase family protein n=1 Tax=Shewanella sp. VB17 TaxID=2739432 RepID=UPI00156368B3|nr:4'-phosphopantetheinyl transferase superfamily protein [Shewanella sp. VB17]NRD71984.1 4'-phosphopantetheinyl transferase superfamily protein [Shewanella sp. VB17]